MFDSLLKAVVGAVIETPVSVVADELTMGGVTTDHDGTYTGAALERILKNIKDAADPDKP